MKIIFQPQRRAAGGDIKQMQRTIEQLRPLGVESDISTDAALDLAPFDLVQLYCLSDPFASLEYFINARRQNKRVVATPIYWNHDQWLQARAQGTRPEFDLSALTAEEQARTRAVQALEEKFYVALVRLIVMSVEMNFAESQLESEIIQTEFGVPAEKMRVTYNGIEPEFARGSGERFRAKYSLRGQDFVLSVARIEERKNTISLIRAWRDETIPLVLAGNAPDPRYLALCRAAAGPHVHFLGRLTPADVADACAAAKVHVLASWWEEASNAALEAAAAGCNMVMTQNSSARDYFRNAEGDDVWLCDPGDEGSIRRALHEALNAPRQTKLAARVREQFTWDRPARVLAEAYREILARPALLVPAHYSDELMNLAEMLAELWELKESHYAALERRVTEQERWTRELTEILAARERERAHVMNFAPIRLARRLLNRAG